MSHISNIFQVISNNKVERGLPFLSLGAAIKQVTLIHMIAHFLLLNLVGLQNINTSDCALSFVEFCPYLSFFLWQKCPVCPFLLLKIVLFSFEDNPKLEWEPCCKDFRENFFFDLSSPLKVLCTTQILLFNLSCKIVCQYLFIYLLDMYFKLMILLMIACLFQAN